MFDSGQVVTPAAFQAWATDQRATERQQGVLAALPPYALTYDPTVIPQLGEQVVKVAGSPARPATTTRRRPGDSHDQR